MGMSPFKSCFTNDDAIAPNPNPNNWTLLEKIIFDNSYILKVKYSGCTNYEGIKILLFEGKYKKVSVLDPHFSEDDCSLVARFRPDETGMDLAVTCALMLNRLRENK